MSTVHVSQWLPVANKADIKTGRFTTSWAAEVGGKKIYAFLAKNLDGVFKESPGAGDFKIKETIDRQTGLVITGLWSVDWLAMVELRVLKDAALDAFNAELTAYFNANPQKKRAAQASTVTSSPVTQPPPPQDTPEQQAAKFAAWQAAQNQPLGTPSKVVTSKMNF